MIMVYLHLYITRLYTVYIVKKLGQSAVQSAVPQSVQSKGEYVYVCPDSLLRKQPLVTAIIYGLLFTY